MMDHFKEYNWIYVIIIVIALLYWVEEYFTL